MIDGSGIRKGQSCIFRSFMYMVCQRIVPISMGAAELFIMLSHFCRSCKENALNQKLLANLTNGGRFMAHEGQKKLLLQQAALSFFPRDAKIESVRWNFCLQFTKGVVYCTDNETLRSHFQMQKRQLQLQIPFIRDLHDFTLWRAEKVQLQ